MWRKLKSVDLWIIIFLNVHIINVVFSHHQVGDDLALRFEITDKTSPYEIFVRELVAMDGQDSSEILLIDQRGCPTDPSIMRSVIQVFNSYF